MTEQELKQKAKELGEQPAFPNGLDPVQDLMDLTKLEFFAGLAMQ